MFMKTAMAAVKECSSRISLDEAKEKAIGLVEKLAEDGKSYAYAHAAIDSSQEMVNYLLANNPNDLMLNNLAVLLDHGHQQLARNALYQAGQVPTEIEFKLHK